MVCLLLHYSKSNSISSPHPWPNVPPRRSWLKPDWVWFGSVGISSLKEDSCSVRGTGCPCLTSSSSGTEDPDIAVRPPLRFDISCLISPRAQCAFELCSSILSCRNLRLSDFNIDMKNVAAKSWSVRNRFPIYSLMFTLRFGATAIFVDIFAPCFLASRFSEPQIYSDGLHAFFCYMQKQKRDITFHRLPPSISGVLRDERYYFHSVRIDWDYEPTRPPGMGR